jgi:anti-anti-sigma factor
VEIGERRHANIVILRPVGRIDNLTSGEFQGRLIAAVTSGGAGCIIDFAAVEFISSAGLRAIMAAARAKPPERQLAVAALNTVVSEVFRISRFSHVVPIFGTVGEAAAALLVPARPHAAAQSAAAPAAAVLGVHFWGTRGSLPRPLMEHEVRAKIREALVASRAYAIETSEQIDEFIDSTLPFTLRGTYGGNTACVQISTGSDEFVLCDLGTGVREFGKHVLAAHGPARKHCYNVFQSHAHWDHIMGFPFFAPAYVPGNLIRVYGCHDMLLEALHNQQSSPCFPVNFDTLKATIEFIGLEPGRTTEIAGLSVTPIKQPHGGDSYGFRFSRDGKTIVYSTDCEHKFSTLDPTYPFIDFYRDADLLIFDAMYSLAEAISVKEDWGHSNNIIAVELAQAARVKRLVLFHHEPAHDDQMIADVLADTIRFEELSRRGHKVEVISAYDGLELTI